MFVKITMLFDLTINIKQIVNTSLNEWLQSIGNKSFVYDFSTESQKELVFYKYVNLYLYRLVNIVDL